MSRAKCGRLNFLTFIKRSIYQDQPLIQQGELHCIPIISVPTELEEIVENAPKLHLDISAICDRIRKLRADIANYCDILQSVGIPDIAVSATLASSNLFNWNGSHTSHGLMDVLQNLLLSHPYIE